MGTSAITRGGVELFGKETNEGKRGTPSSVNEVFPRKAPSEKLHSAMRKGELKRKKGALSPMIREGVQFSPFRKGFAYIQRMP